MRNFLWSLPLLLIIFSFFFWPPIVTAIIIIVEVALLGALYKFGVIDVEDYKEKK